MKERIGIIAQNLAELLRTEEIDCEKRLYELSELARECARAARTGKLSLASPYALADGVLPLFARDEENASPLACYLPFLKAEREHLRILDIAAFSLFFAEHMKDGTLIPFSTGGKPKRTRVAYVRSMTAENAFARISAIARDAAVVYVGSAEEACASVAAGDADYALLPLISRGERLCAIERLTERYKMSISAELRVSAEDEAETAFALFSLYNVPFGEAGEKRTELRFSCASYEAALHVMSSLSLFGYTSRHYTLRPSEYGRVNVRASLAHDGSKAALWIFLSLAANGFDTITEYRCFDA